MRPPRLLPGLLLALPLGCERAGDSAPTPEADMDTDTDADTDADADADADTDPDRWVAMVRTGSSGVPAIEAGLAAAGWEVQILEAEALASELDDRYRLVIYPGSGDPVYDLLYDPGLAGVIEGFVAQGGGFIGICGGALVGGTALVYDDGLMLGMIGLLPAVAQQRSDWYSFYAGNSEIFAWEVVQGHQILPLLAPGETTEITYAGGPFFEPDDPALALLRYTRDLDPSLTDYQVAGQAALLAGTHGAGRVVLSAPHPEYSRLDLLLAWVSWVARAPQPRRPLQVTEPKTGL